MMDSNFSTSAEEKPEAKAEEKIPYKDMPVHKFVYVARGVLDQVNCRRIINEYKDDPMFQWATVQRTGDTLGNLVVDPDFRKVRELLITSPDVWGWSSERIEIAKLVMGAMRSAYEQYINYLQSEDLCLYVPDVGGDEGLKLLHYGKGYKFTEHVDKTVAGGGRSRNLTCSLNLSSGYEGGQFQFFNGAYTKDLGAGDVVVFPSNFLFSHGVTEVTSGERYAIITWLH